MKPLTVVIAVAAATVFVAGCDQAPIVTDPQVQPPNPAFQAIVSKTNEQDVPWTDEHDNPCNGDHVVITGSTHYNFTFVFNNDGTYHLYTRANSKGSGIGLPSLGTYRVDENFYYSEQNPSGEQFTVSSVEQLLIFAPKSADNYIRHTSLKIGANANGVPTATRDTAWSKCVG